MILNSTNSEHNLKGYIPEDPKGSPTFGARNVRRPGSCNRHQILPIECSMMLSSVCLRAEFLRFSSSTFSFGNFRGFSHVQKSGQSEAPVVRCEFRVEAPAAAQVSRRGALAVALGGVGIFLPQNQLGRAGAITEGKQTNLSVEQVKSIIENDIRKGQYYVTGNLTPSIYNDNCKFTDPTTVVTGVKKYVAAVKLLFDPQLSQQELLSIDVTGPRTIEVNWRLGGYLKFPWKPHIMPYEGSTRYTLGEDGLVVSHDETWSISLLTALLELFTPSWGPH